MAEVSGPPRRITVERLRKYGLLRAEGGRFGIVTSGVLMARGVAGLTLMKRRAGVYVTGTLVGH